MKSVLKSLVIAGVLILSACAKDSGGGGATPAVAVVPQSNNCAVGQVYTQYGCLAQSSCPVNFGMYNNQCIPATTANTNGSCAVGQVYTQYGCLAQSTCPVNFGMYNNQCVQAYANGNNNGYYGNGNGGYYNAYYYQNRNAYYGNGGGYTYGYPYATGAGIGAGFYIGGRVSTPGMYYGY